MRLEPNPISGLLFGLGLAALGFFAAGGGHGTYVLIAASSAPLGVFGIWVALAGAPVLWATVGAGFDWLAASRRRWLIGPALMAHYVGTIVLVSREPYGDWAHLWRLLHTLWPALLAWVLLYVAGQIVMWRALLLAPPADTPLQPTSDSRL
jgi:hypothetical protein